MYIRDYVVSWYPWDPMPSLVFPCSLLIDTFFNHLQTDLWIHTDVCSVYSYIKISSIHWLSWWSCAFHYDPVIIYNLAAIHNDAVFACVPACTLSSNDLPSCMSDIYSQEFLALCHLTKQMTQLNLDSWRSKLNQPGLLQLPIYLALFKPVLNILRISLYYAIVILPPYVSHWGVIWMYPTHSD